MDNQLCPHCKETTPDHIGEDTAGMIFWCSTCGTIQTEGFNEEPKVPTYSQLKPT